MIFIFTFFIQSVVAAPAQNSPQNNAVEFDPTVIEATSGFTGMTEVHVKSANGALYSKKMDFTSKIKDSLSEMGELRADPAGGR